MDRKIIIKSDGKDIHASLKNTKSAEKFAALFPYHASGYDSGIDYCCAADTGHNFEADVQIGWKNGDVGFGGGWFSILYAGEEQSSAYTDMVIVALFSSISGKTKESQEDRHNFELRRCGYV